MENLENIRDTEREDTGSVGRSSVTSGYSYRKSEYSIMSKRTALSENRDRSEGLSEREIGRVKKMAKEKDREERKDNIVIKGFNIDERMSCNRIETFMKERLGVEVKVKTWRQSCKVLVVKLESELVKR